jgi:hypothetical protein
MRPALGFALESINRLEQLAGDGEYLLAFAHQDKTRLPHSHRR